MTECRSKMGDPRVSLRCIETDDASFLMELNNDSEIARYVVGNPRQVTLQEQLQWMEKAKSETQTKRFIVECDGTAVGTVILSQIDLSNLTANVNIKLHRSARGKGVGTQSIRLALEYGFETLGLCCITAHVLSFNEASLALFERCGFVREGVLRSRVIKHNERHDLISFSILRSECKHTRSDGERT